MENSKSRKLAVILFADIVGYTALMQKDETSASTLLRRFQIKIETKVVEHNGRIVNFYGDGALCVFNNPLEAVHCAMKLQTGFQKAPNVPVRIGIHSGTVVFENDKVYGDSVNLASRIESMGVQGAILFSKKIKDEIKNQPDLKIKSLGSFAFKNVEEEMEVFVLANEGFVVPKRKALKGKQKTSTTFKRSMVLLLSALLFIVSTFWFYKNNNTLLPESIQNARLAVLPFENKTNDAELDMLGEMASDWIIQGMMNFDELKVVSYKTVIDNLPYLSATTDSPLSFKARTGAEKLIRGNYYLENEKIIIQSQIIDPQNGNIEFAFPEVKGDANGYTSIIKELRERILSYFSVTLKDEYMAVMLGNPPKYEAYKLFMEATNYFTLDGYDKAIPLYNKSIEVDSHFYWPYQQIFFAYS